MRIKGSEYMRGKLQNKSLIKSKKGNTRQGIQDMTSTLIPDTRLRETQGL